MVNGNFHPFFFRQSSAGPQRNAFRLCRTEIHPLPTRWTVPFTLREEEDFSRIMLNDILINILLVPYLHVF